VSDPYAGREQTKAKHFILKHYLEALAFKVLTFSDVTYVDGFSGPWQTKTENFSDSSFMIAISVLRDAQQKIFERDATRRRIRCFFSESDPEAYAQLKSAVTRFHQPEQHFEIMTFAGQFEDAIEEIQSFIGHSFPLIFIDPTGWVGYPLDKIKPLFLRRKCEVLINFMYEFVNRFSHSKDEDIINSLNPILGGPGWEARLDPKLPRGLAVENLFRETLKNAGAFDFVVSTRIDRATAERPHFFITYGTKSIQGLKTFRDIEHAALRTHVRNRARAKEKKREDQTNVGDMFSGHESDIQEATFEEIVEEQKKLASADLIEHLAKRSHMPFSEVVIRLLQPFMLRETNVKDICIALAKNGRIENTWGGGNRKPKDEDVIRRRASPPVD
jgi:three-Cys-motif partner protein